MDLVFQGMKITSLAWTLITAPTWGEPGHCLLKETLFHKTQLPITAASDLKMAEIGCRWPLRRKQWKHWRHVPGLGLFSDVLYGQAFLANDGTNKLGGDQDPQREINLSGLRRAPAVALFPGRVVPTLNSMRGRKGVHLFIRDIGNLEGVVLKLMPT